MSIDRAGYNPSWTEVILGAILSLLLGAVLAAVVLVLKPVSTVRELPKEPDPKTVYYIEGTRDSGRARQASAKQRALLEGGTAVLNEDELNALATPATSKSADAPAEQMLTAGSPNFRIRDGVMQMGVPVRVSVAGLDRRVIVQARGGFEKRGAGFVFVPDELYLGSCPVQRLPIVSGWVMNKLVAGAETSEGLAGAWSRASEVKVEGDSLHVRM
mgnify:CR=1 FL=1|jgi:hypothetical protein